MHNIFKAELEDAFSKNKIEKFEDVPFNTLIDIYWELYNDIEWEIRMKENQKDMEEYYMSLLNEPDKND